MKNKKLIIGLGNPILGDDGLGWRVVEVLEKQIAKDNPEIREQVDIEYYSLGGLSLMEYMEGYDNVLIVDSLVSGNYPQGTILTLPLEAMPDYSTGHTTAIHDTSLQNAMEVGKGLGISLPKHIWLVVIEAQFVYDFSEQLSEPVKRAVPIASQFITNRLIADNWVEKEIEEVTK